MIKLAIRPGLSDKPMPGQTDTTRLTWPLEFSTKTAPRRSQDILQS